MGYIINDFTVSGSSIAPITHTGFSVTVANITTTMPTVWDSDNNPVAKVGQTWQGSISGTIPSGYMLYYIPVITQSGGSQGGSDKNYTYAIYGVKKEIYLNSKCIWTASQTFSNTGSYERFVAWEFPNFYDLWVSTGVAFTGSFSFVFKVTITEVGSASVALTHKLRTDSYTTTSSAINGPEYCRDFSALC